MEINPIRTQRDYDVVLRRIEKLWNSPKGSAGMDELDVLATLIDAYERQHYPIDLPDPLEAIKFRLEQLNLDMRDLVGILGSRTRVYEVMRGKRALSLNMIRSLHHKFGIPANVLIQRLPQKRSPQRRSPSTRQAARQKVRKSA